MSRSHWTLKSIAIVTRFTLDIVVFDHNELCIIWPCKAFLCPCQYCGLQLQPTIVTYGHENLFSWYGPFNWKFWSLPPKVGHHYEIATIHDIHFIILANKKTIDTKTVTIWITIFWDYKMIIILLVYLLQFFAQSWKRLKWRLST